MNRLKNVICAGVVGIGLFVAAPEQADAGGFYLGIGHGHSHYGGYSHGGYSHGGYSHGGYGHGGYGHGGWGGGYGGSFGYGGGYGGWGGYGHGGYGYGGHAWHDTSHYDYHPSGHMHHYGH